MGRPKLFPKRPRWQKWALALTLAIGLYAGLGFLVAPNIVKSQAEIFVLENYGRQVQIGDVKVNPFALSLSIFDFTLPDEDSSPLISFEEFTVNFELSSVVRGALTFGEIRLIAPYLHVKINPDGDLNLAGLVSVRNEHEPEAISQGDPHEAEAEESSIPAILVEVATIKRGRIIFSDLSRPTPFQHEISPLDLDLTDFGTRPDDEAPYSFTATTGAGEAIAWEGSLSVVPLASAGRLTLTGVRPRTAWLYIQDDVRFEVLDGTLDIEGRYALDGHEELTFELSEGAIRLRDLSVAERQSGDVVINIPFFDISGISLSYPEQEAHIDRVTTRGGRYNAHRLAEGEFRGQRLARPLNLPVEDAATPPQENVPSDVEGEDNSRPWTFDVDLIEVSEYHIAFEDRMIPTLFALDINPIELRIEDLSSDLSQPWHVALSLGVGDGGRLQLEGPIQIEPPELDFQVSLSEIGLGALAPYWQDQLAVELTSGRAALEGRMQAHPESATKPQVEFDGDFRIDALRTRDPVLLDELFSFSSLELEGIQVSYEPTAFHLVRLGLDQPSVRVVIDDQGVPNLASIVREGPEVAHSEGVDSPDESSSELVEDEPNEERPPIPATVELVEITNGLAEFEDRSVSPYFSTGISDLNGRIEGLNSSADSQGEVSLSGRLGGATAIQIDGSMNALSEKTALDLKIAFENFGLAPFTPYSGRYVGKAIERGKLFVELNYQLDGNTLTGENSVFLDQFTLGNDIESPDAINLPIGLAVALLKDRKGEIRIDLPVRGEIDDPEFSVGGIIFSALVNLVSKVALSPFSIIGGLAASDGDELRTIEFDPGLPDLSPEQKGKLDALASALAERPVLSLEIKGSASAETDGKAFQAAQFERDLRQRRFKELQSQWFGRKPESADEIVMETEDRSRIVKDVFIQTFGEEAELKLNQTIDPEATNSPERKTAKDVAMAERLRDQIPIAPSTLRDLARKRAAQVQEHIIQVGGVPPERVFVLDVDVQENAQEGDSHTTLSLAAY